MNENVVFEVIDKWLEEDEEDGDDDNLQELYKEEDMDDETDEELNVTVVEVNLAKMTKSLSYDGKYYR